MYLKKIIDNACYIKKQSIREIFTADVFSNANQLKQQELKQQGYEELQFITIL